MCELVLNSSMRYDSCFFIFFSNILGVSCNSNGLVLFLSFFFSFFFAILLFSLYGGCAKIFTPTKLAQVQLI